MAGLTAKQEMFCKEYIIDLNSTQASIRAGYSKKTANVIGPENLAKPCIAERIAELSEDRLDRVKVDADDVLRDLMELKDICMGKKDITITDKDGALTTTQVFEHSGANKSLELIGRHLKMFTDKLDINAHLKLDGMSDDDLENELNNLDAD